MTEWLPINADTPTGEPHFRGLHVNVRRADWEPFVYWDCFYGWINDRGEWVTASDDYCGWDADDFSHWLPAPNPPEQS